MKNKILPFCLLIFLVQIFTVSVLSQIPSSPNPPVVDKRENIKPDELNAQNRRFNPPKDIIELLSPSLNVINFDDIIFSDDNSIEISPNRYAGVSFYYPGAATWLSHFLSYSSPNSLLVGNADPYTYSIHSPGSLTIEFAQPSKDINFWWGRQQAYYNNGQIQIYNQNYQLVATVPVYFNGYSWINISLNQYSQSIKKIVLQRPPVADDYQGHILIDNFQFSPVTTSSPTGYFDAVSVREGVATGWSVDPDNPSVSNSADCYINNQYAGRTTANLPSPDLPYPGNHRFSLPIPAQYRNGSQYQITCWGIDIAGGDPNAVLPGSPKTFVFKSPIGWLEGVNSDGNATGWTIDPDIPEQPTYAHFYIDGPAGGGGAYIGQKIARTPRPDVNASTGLPGDHGYSFSIPAQYRDGAPHTLYAYGIDLTGGSNVALNGNPKTFTLSPKVQSVTFVPFSDTTHGSSFEPNPKEGAGQRIFPDKQSPTDNFDRKTLRVKAVVGKPNVMVYFKNYDIDDPSTDDPPVDFNSNLGNDNNGSVGGSKSGLLTIPDGAVGCQPFTGGIHCLTNSNGEVTVNFIPTMQPGDNFTIAASTNLTYLASISIEGINLRDASGVLIPRPNELSPNANAGRTEMLTTWRKVHIEVDSMGEVSGNYLEGKFSESKVVGNIRTTVQINKILPSDQYKDGRVTFGSSSLKVVSNNYNTLDVISDNGRVRINAEDEFILYDDDDFNDLDGNLLHGDSGEDVSPPSMSRLTEGSDNWESNILAEAYIQPVYSVLRLIDISDNSIFVLNLRENSTPAVRDLFVDQDQRNTDTDNEFWTIYILGAYQPFKADDNDPPFPCDNSPYPYPCPTLGTVDEITNDQPGSEGSGAVIFLETHSIHEGEGYPSESAETVAHEVGHLFSSVHGDGGIMGDYVGLGFYSNKTLDKIRKLKHP